MTRVAAESRLPLWQMLQIIGIIAENSLPAWEALQMTEMIAENCFLA
jgi:hypothetical protein